jgi:hypothetical protein
MRHLHSDAMGISLSLFITLTYRTIAILRQLRSAMRRTWTSQNWGARMVEMELKVILVVRDQNHMSS